MPAGLLQDPYAMFTREGWKAHDDWKHRRADELARYFAENRKSNPFLSGKPLTAQDMMAFVGSTGPAKGMPKLRWEKGQSTFLPKESALKRLDPDTGEELTAKYVAGGGGPDKGLSNAEAAGLLNDVADVWAYSPVFKGGYGKHSTLGKHARTHAAAKLEDEGGVDYWKAQQRANRIRDAIDDGMKGADTHGFALNASTVHHLDHPMPGASDMSYVWLQNKAGEGAKSTGNVSRLIKEMDASRRLGQTARHETGHVLNSRSGNVSRGGVLTKKQLPDLHPILAERNYQYISLLDGKVHPGGPNLGATAPLSAKQGNAVLEGLGITGNVRTELLKLGRLARPEGYQWQSKYTPSSLERMKKTDPGKYKKLAAQAKESNEKFQRTYLTTVEEIMADATALYQANPKFVKEVAPNAARWIRERFNKSLTKNIIQFGSMAAPVGALGVMADRSDVGGPAGLLQSGQEY